MHHGVRSDARISFVFGSFFTVLFSFCSILLSHDRPYWRFLTALVQGKGFQFRWGVAFPSLCEMLENNNNPNSDTSSVASAAVGAENNNDASSITFVNAFAAIGVAATVDDEEQLKQPPPSNLPCPFSKIQKKPSSCMTGTPSSAQRPSKIRQSTSMPPRTTVPHLASTQPEITQIDELNLLLPPQKS